MILKRILTKREENVWADSSGTKNLPVAGTYDIVMKFLAVKYAGIFFYQQSNY
jgi:hypothetical protein